MAHSMSELSFHFLGELRITRQGQELALPPSKKTRALLAYLALNPRPLRREFLCELLWDVPDDPRGSLRWSLSKLRRLVDDDQHRRIQADRNHVAMDCSAVSIDSLALKALLEQDLHTVSVEQLQAAAAHYCAPFLEGLELPNFHEFYSWCIAQREELKQAQLAILEEICRRLPPEKALPYNRKRCHLSPYDQQIRAELISRLMQLGRKAEAATAYQQGLDLLQEAGAADDGRLYRALHGAPGVAAPPPTPAAATGKPPRSASHHLVGRDKELAAISEALEQNLKGRRARVLLLKGEPGIGKTHLLTAAAAMAREHGASVLKAVAFESERLRPFALWNDALRRFLPGNTTTELLSSHQRVSRERVFDSLSQVLQQQCAQRPAVILLDDLQWCDESSASALHYVLRMNQRLPVVVICAARIAELRDNPSLQLALRGLRQDGLLQEMAVEHLTEGQLARLIQGQFPAVDAERLCRESNGNPLLALELARSEAEGGIARSLYELVQERLSRLNPEAVEILNWAAVLAPCIDLPYLESASKLPQQAILHAIELAEQQGILLPAERGFRFSHDLISQCIYEAISPTKRQSMHRCIAELLETNSRVDLQLAADLAHHAARSGDPELACRASIAAARLCLRFYANDDALKLYQQGMSFSVQLAEAQRVCTQLELADIHITATPIDNWQEAAEQLTVLAEQALDFGALAYARLGYQQASYLRWRHGQWQEALNNSLQGERITRAGSDRTHIVGMAEAAKCLALLEKDLSQADAMVMEARALARREAVSCVAIPLTQGMLHYYQGKMAEAFEALEEARALCKSQGDRINEFLANEFLAYVQIEQQDYRAALRYGEALLDIGEKLSEGSEGPFARALNALCLYALEDDDRDLEASFEQLRQADAKQRLAYLLNRAAQLSATRQHWSQVIRYGEEALALAKTMHRRSEVVLALRQLAEAHEQLGQSSLVEQCLDQLHLNLKKAVAHWARAPAQQLLEQKVEGLLP